MLWRCDICIHTLHTTISLLLTFVLFIGWLKIRPRDLLPSFLVHMAGSVVAAKPSKRASRTSNLSGWCGTA